MQTNEELRFLSFIQMDWISGVTSVGIIFVIAHCYPLFIILINF